VRQVLDLLSGTLHVLDMISGILGSQERRAVEIVSRPHSGLLGDVLGVDPNGITVRLLEIRSREIIVTVGWTGVRRLFYSVDMRERPMDPGVLDRQHADSLWDDMEFTPPSPERLDRLQQHLDRIPPIEADYILLYYLKGKRQDDIAAIFHRTQADVSYRVARGIERIQFLESLPEVTEDEIVSVLAPHISEFNLKILLGMYRTTCQSAVARELGISQGKVRHRFVSSISIIKRLVAEGNLAPRFLAVFEHIARNGNILQEVSYVRWGHPERVVA
jgi:hypothetical protein